MVLKGSAYFVPTGFFVVGRGEEAIPPWKQLFHSFHNLHKKKKEAKKKKDYDD